MFAGGNTPRGFYSCFNHIMPLERAEKRVFLKGSSGSGKSTFMKKMAAEFESIGYNVDYFHCSNDVNSLDAIAVDEKGLCIIDGTSPHTLDPELPGPDEIINLGEFINENKITPYADEIRQIFRWKKGLIDRAYGYFAAALEIYNINKTLRKSFIKQHELTMLINEKLDLISGPFDGLGGAIGSDRRLFASAITPDGARSFVKTLFEGCIVYGLHSETGMGADEFLSKIQKRANDTGLKTESYICPFEPLSKTEHLIIPDLKIAFTTINRYHKYENHVNSVIDFMDCADIGAANAAKDEIERNNNTLEYLLGESTRLFKSARDLHDRIEEIYSKSIDFEGVNKLTERMIKRLCD